MAVTSSRSRALRPAKRDAILRAARKTFATMGFARATIDAIAAEANVSTRTLYKHFRNKDELFATVLEASATAVADDYEASVRAGTAAVQTAHERLTVLARAATKQALGHPEHFAMIRQISNETAHFPAGVLAAWRKAGPERVERQTIAQLRKLHDEGLLEIEDFHRAARHFLALTTAETNRHLDGKTLSPRATENAIAAGVEVFARGYAPR
ncbi:MAG: TetR/AcrR family transcriptional regulator [Solirubrobacterales bacterium]|nr:TetR/AcrR family transcriptional regulator [Solirubrobacterales bacterium]MBV9471591.1 TetR/AcrR family transcriptional regulator [Solirubrobacterales bacterium]